VIHDARLSGKRRSHRPQSASCQSDTEEGHRLRTPPRILVVDDNPTNLEVLRVRLIAHGYEVVTAVDGEDALNRVRGVAPDLVLLDVMMPKVDGISVVRELKQDNTLRFTPIILVTAKSDTRDVIIGLEAGADDYLTKPFEHAALIARVRSMLRIKDLHDTVRSQATQLKEQTEQLSSWNRMLEERVTEQLAHASPFHSISRRAGRRMSGSRGLIIRSFEIPFTRSLPSRPLPQAGRTPGAAPC